MSRGLAVALALAGAAGCAAEAPVPELPTWVEHVKPILQANCFHCHGPSADSIRQPTMPVYRWDVYDLTDPKYALLGFTEVAQIGTVKTFVSARDTEHFGILALWADPSNADDIRMPPPPATPLTRRDLEVLERWKATGYTLGTRAVNGSPEIRWLAQGQIFAITDSDGDQVLGKLTCGGTDVPILRSGSHQLPPGVIPPCSAMIYDGFDLVSTDLK